MPNANPWRLDSTTRGITGQIEAAKTLTHHGIALLLTTNIVFMVIDLPIGATNKH